MDRSKSETLASTLNSLSKVTANIILGLIVGTTVQAGVKQDRCVVVYLRDNAQAPTLVKVRAQGIVTKMFANIRVQIRWKDGVPKPASPTGTVGIELTTKTPATLKPDAMAFAFPNEGVHIRVFYDRIEKSPSPAGLLAHVLAHEITHILEGISRHSDTGLMKAHWTLEDYYLMRSRTLPFAPEDVELIFRGLDSSGSAKRPCSPRN